MANVVVALRLVGDQGELEPGGRLEEPLLHAVSDDIRVVSALTLDKFLAVVQHDGVLLRAPAPELAPLGILQPELHFDAVARLEVVDAAMRARLGPVVSLLDLDPGVQHAPARQAVVALAVITPRAGPNFTFVVWW